MTLKYPANIDGSRDFIKFTIGKYEPPVATGGASVASYVSDLPELSGDAIVLNMPSDIGSSFTGAWAGKSTTGLAQAALSGVRGLGNLAKASDFQNKLNTLNTDLQGNLGTNLMGAGVEDVVKFLGDTLGQAPGLGSNLGANDFLQIASGTIINPNTELFYGGPELRTHGYSFKLIPQSKVEAENIRQIVERFQQACLPKKGTSLFGAKIRNFIPVPEVCQIQFCGAGGGENKNLPKYKTSAFTSVSASYITDGQYMSFRDGEPIGINLTITLKELKLVYRDDIGSSAR